MEYTDTGIRLGQLDPLIHEPARLRILTFLASCEQVEFTTLRRVTDMTDGNLSAHIGRLEKAGLVGVDRQIVAKRTQTMIWLTDDGRDALEKHWQVLDDMRRFLHPHITKPLEENRRSLLSAS